jgi:hypothetical protein
MPSLCKLVQYTQDLPLRICICHNIMKVKRLYIQAETLDVNWRDIDS